MERFAKIKNVGTRRRLDVQGICRCCGLQLEEKFSILDQFCDDEVNFQEKVKTLTGINVIRNDKMPPFMCEPCMDKINDFFEFRLMAQNTEKQTREALGLPQISPVAKYIDRKPVVRLVDLKYSAEENILIEKALARSREAAADNIPSTSKKRAEKTTPAQQPPTKKSKMSCLICTDAHFSYQSDLNDHLIKEHLPLIAKYACGSCRETFEQLSDHKAHEARHTKERLPYTCFTCLSVFSRPQDFKKHMTNYNCHEKEKLVMTVEDIKCFQCRKKFLTQNLFEWHACFLKPKANCSKCGQYYQKKKALFKHYVMCEGRFETPASARDPAMRFKAERDVMGAPEAPKKTKAGPKKKTVPQRKMSTIIKTELNIESNADPPEDDEYSNYEDSITYDNFGDDDSETDDALEPIVELQEQIVPPIRIKMERSTDVPAVQQTQPQLTADIIRNIKKEKSASATIVTTAKPLTQQQKNLWKLKIKAERNSTQPAVTQVLNPLAVGAAKHPPKTGNKFFKIPQGLRMKIKMEKKDAGYGDDMEERDEAEPEDEDLLNHGPESPTPAVVRIKQEKIDPAYGDSRKATKNKQLINPMALIMARKKPLTNGAPENSLVISAVTSINPSSPGDENTADRALTQSDAETLANAPETFCTNDATAPRDNNLMMVQIPSECLDNQENHSFQLAAHDESSRNETAPEAASKSGANEKLGEIQQMDTNDDLDALLKKYEDTAPADNNDLFQELLKFD